MTTDRDEIIKELEALGLTWLHAARAAKYITEKFVTRTAYDTEVRRLASRVGELEDEDREEPRCEKPHRSPSDRGVLTAVTRLREEGATLLEFRPGATELDKVLDFIEKEAA